jgi:hypothetical protein
MRHSLTVIEALRVGPAARAKARTLALLMKQESQQWAASMREISAFIDRAT